MDTETIVIHLPLRPNRLSGRKYLVSAEGETVPLVTTQQAQKTMQMAIVRAFLWRRRIESGKCQGITDMARQEKVNGAYVFRQLTLTCLAPEIIEIILNNTQPGYWTLLHLYDVIKLPWEQQKEKLFQIKEKA